MIHKFFTLPIKAMLKVSEIIHDEADKELYDIERIQSELIQLQLKFELGEVEETDYVAKEEELLTRFQTAKERELGEIDDWDVDEEEEES